MSDPIQAALLLRALVERRFEKNQALAAEWMTQWNARPGRKLTLDTVESRLSNLLADNDQGWVFFFKDAARSTLLFTLLDVSEPERERIEAAAKERLAGKRSARLCVDLHDVEGDADALLAAVEDSLLALSGAAPAVVILTHDQYRRLPITYADRKETLDLVRVDGDDQAATAIARCPRALVVARLPPRADDGAPALERWAGCAFVKGMLVVEPAGAVARFLAEGALDPLPSVPPAHRLDALGVVPLAPTSGPRGPALRRRLVALADGTADGTPEARLGEAQAWRVVASSTDDERVRAVLVGAGVTAEPVDRAALDHALDRAGRRPGTGVYAADGGWHFLNVEPPAALADHPRVTVHRVEARPTALRRLHDAVRGRTALEMSFDPFLADAVAALDPEGAEADALAHARAWLLHGGLAPVDDRACVDPLPRLARLLAGDAPMAEVRLRRRGPMPAGAMMGALHDWEPLLASIWEQVPPSGTDCWHGRDQWWMVAWPADTKTLGELCRAKDSYARWQWQPEPPEDAWAGPIHVGRAALPEALPIDEDAWLDAFEARGPEDPAENLKQRFDVAREAAYALRTKQLTGARRRTYYGEEIVSAADAADAARNEMRNQGGIGLTGHDLVRSDAVVQALPDPDWQDLDLHLALAWLALRQALAARAPLRLHDGRFVLPIQPGVFAEITVVAAPEDAPTRAGFGRVCEVHLDEASVSPDWSRWTLAPPAGAPTVHLYASPIFAPISTFAGRLQVGQKYGTGAIDLGVVVPAELHLVGEGVAATVRFRAEPYGLAGGAPTPRAG